MQCLRAQQTTHSFSALQEILGCAVVVNDYVGSDRLPAMADDHDEGTKGSALLNMVTLGQIAP